MSDLNWCTYCDTAISHYSDSLYCSEECLRADALRNHPLLGYDWQELVDFPRPQGKRAPLSPSVSVSSQQSPIATLSTEPSADSTRSFATSFRTSSATLPSSFPSSTTSSLCGSPALTACSTLPSSPSSYSSALPPPSNFDMLSLTAGTNRKQPKPIRHQTSLLFTSTTSAFP
ncbi:hypothetical protein BJV82DRAFT_666604 [Fennellomyces sp. T-0311]|nr:hypothetical protein BJV82DRAFT_666604 [Fennellomyces sp. T-0311]